MTADELRAIRAVLGLSARGLGLALGGTNPRTVRRWEAGDSPIPGAVVLLLVRLVQEKHGDLGAALLVSALGTGKDVAA